MYDRYWQHFNGLIFAIILKLDYDVEADKEYGGTGYLNGSARDLDKFCLAVPRVYLSEALEHGLTGEDSKCLILID